MNKAVETVAGMLDCMAELTRIVATNRASLALMGGRVPALRAAQALAHYDLVLNRAKEWMGAAEVEAIVRETEQAMRAEMARQIERPRAARTA